MDDLLKRLDNAPMGHRYPPGTAAMAAAKLLNMSDAIEQQQQSPSGSGQCDAKLKKEGGFPLLLWNLVGDDDGSTTMPESGHGHVLPMNIAILESEPEFHGIIACYLPTTFIHNYGEVKRVQIETSNHSKFGNQLNFQAKPRGNEETTRLLKPKIKIDEKEICMLALLGHDDSIPLQVRDSILGKPPYDLCWTRNFENSDNSKKKNCQRCELLDENLKELFTENNSLKARVRGIEVLGDSLIKAQEELAQTTVKNAKLDKAVGNLQSRLHRVGCDTTVDLAEDEIFIPGHDRTFLNSLICENGKLQKEMRELKMKFSGDARSYQKQSDTGKDKQLQDLQKDLLSKNARIVELESQRDHLQILDELKEFKTLCSVLTPQTKKLQDDLEALQRKYQEVFAELADWKEKARIMESKITRELSQKMSTEEEGRVSLSDRLKIGEEQIKQLEKENSRLTDQLREVIGMNTRWQRYNEQRETYVLKQSKTGQQQQSKITVLEQQVRDLEQTINRLNLMLQKMESGKKKNTDAYVMSLEQQLAQKEDEVIELNGEVAKLKITLHTSDKQRGVAQRLEDKEMIATLKEQVKIYKEDFNQERRDRERLQGNNDILRHRLKEAKYKYTPPADVQRFVGSPAGLMGYYEQPQPRRLVTRGIPAYQDPYQDPLLPSDVVTDSVDETDAPGNELNNGGDQLQCPRCPASYAVTDHSAFMHHATVCLQ